MGLIREIFGVPDGMISFDNCRIVLANNEIANGSVLVEDGVIRDVCAEIAPDLAHRIDLDGKILMPGLIDLHSDAIEHELEPRPKTFLPFELAVRQADRLFANVGVTTAFHSLSFWSDGEITRNNSFTAEFARAITKLTNQAIIDNRVHARYEITNAAGLPHVSQVIEDGVASLVSIMDHTPGQGQYPDESMFRDYLRSTGVTDVEADVILEKKRDAVLQSRPSVEAVCKLCREFGIPLASHDDDLPERFADHAALGVTISEFPMNKPAAQKGILYGFTVLVGSPNVMRGQSTGAGPKAMDLIEAGFANGLCSDYMPATLLPAVFKIVSELGWPLWRAAQLVTLQPAKAAKLTDRGEISPGKRADLIVVEPHYDWPIVRYLWSAGKLSYASLPIDSSSIAASAKVCQP